MNPAPTPIPAAAANRKSLRDARTYHVSDDRLRDFAGLSYAQRLHWVEQCSLFVRMGQEAKEKLNAGIELHAK
jgi:hypothetical protein